MKRRQRSNMTLKEAHRVFDNFSIGIKRFVESSGDEIFNIAPNTLPSGTIVIKFLVDGGFGVAADLFEAIRVCGGHKLPAKEQP